jgi:hypothetical protein
MSHLVVRAERREGNPVPFIIPILAAAGSGAATAAGAIGSGLGAVGSAIGSGLSAAGSAMGIGGGAAAAPATATIDGITAGVPAAGSSTLGSLASTLTGVGAGPGGTTTAGSIASAMAPKAAEQELSDGDPDSAGAMSSISQMLQKKS